MKKVLQNILSYWKSTLTTVIILCLSLLPSSAFKSAPSMPNADKIVHVLMYLALTILLIYEFRRNSKTPCGRKSFLIICILYPLLFGGFVEIVQRLSTLRAADWLDCAANAVGILIAWLVMTLLPAKNTKK